MAKGPLGGAKEERPWSGLAFLPDLQLRNAACLPRSAWRVGKPSRGAFFYTIKRYPGPGQRAAFARISAARQPRSWSAAKASTHSRRRALARPVFFRWILRKTYFATPRENRPRQPQPLSPHLSGQSARALCTLSERNWNFQTVAVTQRHGRQTRTRSHGRGGGRVHVCGRRLVRRRVLAAER